MVRSVTQLERRLGEGIVVNRNIPLGCLAPGEVIPVLLGRACANIAGREENLVPADPQTKVYPVVAIMRSRKFGTPS